MPSTPNFTINVYPFIGGFRVTVTDTKGDFHMTDHGATEASALLNAEDTAYIAYIESGRTNIQFLAASHQIDHALMRTDEAFWLSQSPFDYYERRALRTQHSAQDARHDSTVTVEA